MNGYNDNYGDLFEFYDNRGYGHRIGIGAHPALIIIDFSCGFTQGSNDFPGGNFSEEINATNRLLNFARGQFPVFFTTISYDDPEEEGGWWAKKVPWLLCLEKLAEAVKIDPILGWHPEDVLIEKRFPSSFHGTKLHALLQKENVDTLIITGCTTSVCVRATAVDAMQHGYRAIVVPEAVGDFHPIIHNLNLKDLDSRYADVTPLSEVLAHLEAISSTAIK